MAGSSRSRRRPIAGAVEPDGSPVAAAKAKADAALKDLQGGKAWDDVAKTVSTDASTAPQAGDLGWIQADDSQADPAFLAALFAAAANAPTAVIEGEDGIFRIGRVTEVAAESVDTASRQPRQRRHRSRQVPGGRQGRRHPPEARGLDRRRRARAGTQRDVSEIYLSQATVDLPRRGRQGPPHPVLAERRSQRRPGRHSADDPRGPRPRPTPTPPTASCSWTRPVRRDGPH